MPFSVFNSQREIGENPLDSESGTPYAIYNTSKCARQSNAKSFVSTWGGARNRADRVSDSITAAQASGLIDAAQRAWTIGLPLNRHVTIQWTRAGIADREAAAATGAFLTLVRDWLRKRGGQLAYVWVRENDKGDGAKGSHVHILMHIPSGAPWTYWRSRHWLERVTGKPYRKGVIHTARIAGTVKACTMAPERYLSNLAAVVGYVIKGASERAAKALDLERRACGGLIIGKRMGWSQNIGHSSVSSDWPLGA